MLYNNYKWFYFLEIIFGVSVIWGISLSFHEKNFTSWGLFAFLCSLDRDIRIRKILLAYRIIHTFLGCIAATLVISICGFGYPALYISTTITVIVPHLFKHYPIPSWKVAPGTCVVLNILGILYPNSPLGGIRIYETIFGAYLAIFTNYVYILSLKYLNKEKNIVK